MPPSQRPLHSSAQSFLSHLNLPHHPDDDIRIEELSTVGEGVFELPLFHSSRSTTSSQRSNYDTNLKPPKIGPISMLELHDNSYAELIKTAWTMSAPTLAMAELWLRLFALVVGPMCVACLVYWEIRRFASFKNNASRSISKTIILVAVLGVASSGILFTDALYVYEYGRSFGCGLFVATSFLALRVVGYVKRSSKETITNDSKNNCALRVTKNKAIGFSSLIYGLIITTMIVFARSDGGHAMRQFLEKVAPISILSGFVSASTTTARGEYNLLTHLGDPGIDLPTIEPGFYHSSNPLIQSIAKHWPESSRTYDVRNGATPYLVNGDQRTGIPFLVNKVEEQEYLRVYVRNPFDQENIALDIAFPYGNNEKDDNVQDSTTFTHNMEKPVYLVLHGLNGGSHEEYVKDFVLRRRSEGSTVVVMIARGMMDTTMRGWNVFHGARTGDVDIAARAVKRGLEQAAKEKGMDVPVLAGVGYSMGAIILSNYVARSGLHCALDTAIAVSGGLDMRQQLNFKRSMRLWQPMLTFGLREDILLGKYARHYKHRLTQKQFRNMLRVTSISHLDVEAIVNYNSFNDLVHYYSEMSAMGDRNPEFQLFDDYDGTCKTSQDRSWGRISNVSVPFLVLQALDDPLVGWRTVGTENATDLVNSGSGNTVLLLTKAGGHVGWPMGLAKENGWKWMNNVVSSFVEAFSLARNEVESSQSR